MRALFITVGESNSERISWYITMRESVVYSRESVGLCIQTYVRLVNVFVRVGVLVHVGVGVQRR